MKKYLLLIPVLLFALPVSAADFVSKENGTYSIPAGQTQTTDIYAGGKQVDIAGTVAADAYIAGETVSVSGTVNEDLFAGGRTISISGTVNQDVRAAGQTITVSGKIHGDLLIAGESLSILPGAVIDGDLLFMGKTLTIEGEVKGEVRALGSEVSVAGGKTGKLSVRAENLTLTNATISGDVTYRSSSELIKDSATVISGKVTRLEMPAEGDMRPERPLAAFSLAKIFMLLAMVWLAVWLFARPASAAVDEAIARPVKNILVGVAVLIAIPIISIVLLFTVVGLPLGSLMLFLYGALIIVAKIISALLVGAVLARIFTKEYRVTYLWALVGVAAMTLLPWIPFVGWIPTWVAFFLMMGVLFRAGEKAVFPPKRSE